MNKLYIPRDKETFDFPKANEMSIFQLKKFCDRLWKSLGNLANICDDVYPDVSDTIDCMREGYKFSSKNMIERYRYTYHKRMVIQYDSKDNSFRILEDDDLIELKSMNEKELKECLK